MNVTVSLTVTTSLTSLPILFAKLREIEELGGGNEPLPPTAAPQTTPSAASDEVPASLTDAQGRLFVLHCSTKTLEVLRSILDGRPLPFRLSVLAKDLGRNMNDLGWVWGGLTKRVRNVIGDRNARLIVWHNYLDAAGKWIDADGVMAETTISALRKRAEHQLVRGMNICPPDYERRAFLPHPLGVQPGTDRAATPSTVVFKVRNNNDRYSGARISLPTEEERTNSPHRNGGPS